MAGERIYGGSNMTTVLENEGISCSSSSPFEPLFISNSISPSFLGSRSMVNFEGVHGGKKSDKSFYRRLDEEENCNEDLGEGFYHHTGKKRRLTTNQVEFLERNFELENKLEPERKIQLARDLGLNPRQIAIWFQNRRARWKTKQLEKDYEILKGSYQSLQADYDNLLKEKEKLKTEVVILKEKLLLKEKKSESSERLEPNNKASDHPQSTLKLISKSNSVEQESNNIIVQVLACKHEALSSGNSDILDSDNPHYIDVDGVQSSRFEPAVSSHVFEPEPDDSTTDLSQDEDDENLSKRFFPPVYQVPKLEDDDDDDDDHHPYHYQLENSSSHRLVGVGAEDQPLWFWC